MTFRKRPTSSGPGGQNRPALRLTGANAPVLSQAALELLHAVRAGILRGDAIAAKARLEAATPSDVEAPLLLLKAAVALSLGETGPALEMCRALFESLPGDADVEKLAGHIHLARGEMESARRGFEKVLAVRAHDKAAAINAFSPAKSPKPPEEPLPRMVAATSIPPRRHGFHARVLKTWAALGFEIISVNPAAEIEALAPLFPETRFVQASNIYRSETGNPYVRLDALFDVLAGAGAEVCGIVNADVAFGPCPDLPQFLAGRAPDGLVFGSRVDVAESVASHGSFFDIGFDYFFFGQKLLRALPGSDFCMGLPWWDYFTPRFALEQGFPTVHNLSPVAFHVLHPTSWSPKAWHEFGLHFAQNFIGPDGPKASDFALSLPGAGRMHFLLALSHLTREFIFAKSEPLMCPVPYMAGLVSPFSLIDMVRENPSTPVSFNPALDILPATPK